MNYRTNYAITTLALVMASAPALASRQCSDYLSGVNKELASSLSSASKRQLMGLGIGPKGELLVSNGDGYFEGYTRADMTTVPPYMLPEFISKKLSYRFTDVATKGVRNASGRLVCLFRGEWNDGYDTGKVTRAFDVEPFADTSEVSMFVSPGEGWLSGSKFRAGSYAQEIIDSAVKKSLASDPKYKEKFTRKP
jgi:hypothetical protein